MGSFQAIANYEQLSALTRQMREAAEQGEWDKLISIEHQCSELVVTMKAVDAAATLDEAARHRKDQLIADILADDAEIRKHVQVWMGQLQHNMQSNRQEQLVLKAYGA
ncbi:flagellar protein FliT [Sulfuritalea sp.]|uniref:flagellar protein FliT n=1 Tax=Sulfuritalea sp. TaxID=2480090 RepID=UPI00286EA3C0|nr:flagellar protein FliT [Sulfuritalea sp.]